MNEINIGIQYSATLTLAKGAEIDPKNHVDTLSSRYVLQQSHLLKAEVTISVARVMSFR